MASFAQQIKPKTLGPKNLKPKPQALLPQCLSLPFLPKTSIMCSRTRASFGRRCAVSGCSLPAAPGFLESGSSRVSCGANDRLGLQAEMVVLSRDPAAFCRKMPHLADRPALTFCSGDVRRCEFPGGRYSHVIHAATPASAALNAEDPLLMLDTIVEGTRRALAFARSCGARRFLLTSSGAVYGTQPPAMTHIPETYCGAPDPMDRSSAYGQGKRLAEHLCAFYAERYGIATTIARGFAFVGPHLPLDQHFAIGNFIRDALGGGPIVVQGDGTPFRSYLYASDLAIALWTILLRGESCQPYNVGSSAGLSIADVARAVASQCPDCRVVISRQANPAAPPSRYVPTTDRAERELGLKQRIELNDAIQRTLDWHRTPAR